MTVGGNRRTRHTKRHYAQGTGIDLRRCAPCPADTPEGAVWRLRPGPLFRPDLPQGGGGEEAGALPVVSLDLLSPDRAVRVGQTRSANPTCTRVHSYGQTRGYIWNCATE